MSFYKEVPGRQTTLESTLKFDTAPTAGSTNPVTSDGIATAITEAVGGASDALQEQIDDIAEKAGSGYTPKGEATVATLNGLSGQENGELYTMTDAGTLTDGSLAVSAGDTVAWDATNSVWYKAMDYAPRQYGTNEVHNLPTTITAFRTGDVIPVDGPSGTAKMSNDDLLKETAENALVGNVAPAFDPTKPNGGDGFAYHTNDVVIYDGKLYVFVENKTIGSWDASKVKRTSDDKLLSEKATTESVDDINISLCSYGANIYATQSTISNARISNANLKVIASSANLVRYIAVNKGDILKYYIYHWSGRFITCAFFLASPTIGSTATKILHEESDSNTTYFAEFSVVAPENGYIAVAMSSNSQGNNNLKKGVALGKIDELNEIVSSQSDDLIPVRENVYRNSRENPINWICRLGWGVYNAGSPPEQSIASYRMAYDKGCRFVLFDIRLTADNKFVCVHDDRVNNIIRNPDGTSVESDVYVSTSTLAELNAYDWGLYKGQKWEGTKVLELEEILRFCKYMRINCIAEFKVSFTDSQLEEIATLIKMYGLEKSIMMNVGNVTNANKVVALLPDANIGYGYGTIEESKINEIKNSDLKAGKRFACFSLSNYYNTNIAKKAAEASVDLWFTEVDTLATLQAIDSDGLLDGCKYISSRVNLLDYLVSKYPKSLWKT